jgi:hypothetical protein
MLELAKVRGCFNLLQSLQFRRKGIFGRIIGKHFATEFRIFFSLLQS